MTGISLAKGNSLSLTKQDGGALTRVILGLGWDAAKRGLFGGSRSIDLDASAILFDGNGRDVDSVWYGHLNSNDGSIRHSGDNLTGAGDGDDEQIVVNLDQVPANVQNIVLTINSYSGHKFSQVMNVFARVVDATTNQELVRYNLAESKDNTAVLIAKLTRSGNGWVFTALGEFADGKTVAKLVAPARNFL